MMAELLNLKAATPGPERRKSVVRGASASGLASGTQLSFPPVIAILLFRLGMEWVSALLNRKGGPHMIALNIPRPRRAERTSLCEGCVFAHIIRGFELREVLVFCGYAFPLREVLFSVRDCSDFKPKRAAEVAGSATEELVLLEGTESGRGNLRVAAGPRTA